MQRFLLEEDYPLFPPSPNNPTNEGAIEESISLDMESMDPLDHQEVVVEKIKEGFLSLVNTH